MPAPGCNRIPCGAGTSTHIIPLVVISVGNRAMYVYTGIHIVDDVPVKLIATVGTICTRNCNYVCGQSLIMVCIAVNAKGIGISLIEGNGIPFNGIILRSIGSGRCSLQQGNTPFGYIISTWNSIVRTPMFYQGKVFDGNIITPQKGEEGII